MADEEFPGAEYDELVADEDTDPDVFAESPTVPGGPRGIVANLTVDLVTTAEQIGATGAIWSELARALSDSIRSGKPISPGNLASALYLATNELQESVKHVNEIISSGRHIAGLLLDQAAKENAP
jgi:hypothetical protein